MGLMEKGKEKTLVGKNKSVVSKLCVLSCMSLWCQALQSPVFPIFQTAIRTGFNLACAAFFILFLLSSFLPYLTLLCCSDLNPPLLTAEASSQQHRTGLTQILKMIEGRRILPTPPPPPSSQPQPQPQPPSRERERETLKLSLSSVTLECLGPHTSS